MRQYGILIILVVLVISMIAVAIYHFFRTVTGMFEDQRIRKELEELSQISQTQREEKLRKNEERLDNGCNHQWGAMIQSFPANACRKCGLEKENPAGSCDHVWRVEMVATPYGYCEKCEKRYVNESILG